MEKYKKVLKTRIALFTVPVLLAIALGIYDVFFASEAIKESFIFGFQCGAASVFYELDWLLILSALTMAICIVLTFAAKAKNNHEQ